MGKIYLEELVEKLLELRKSGASGVLEVWSEELRTSLFVSKGTIVFAQDGTLGETLGRLLLKQNVITEEQYETALYYISELRTAGEGKKLGQVLVELGFLTKEEVETALSAQVRFKVIRCLQWKTGSMKFLPNDGRLANVEEFPAELEPLIVRALKHMPFATLKELTAPVAAKFPVLKERIAKAARLLQLSAPEIRMLHQLDGSRPLSALAGLVSSQGTPPFAVFHALHLVGLLEFRDSASTVELDDSPPSTNMPARPPSWPPTKPAVPRIDKKVTVPAIPRVSLGAKPSPDANKIKAEQLFQSSKKALRADRIGEAIGALEQATALFPDAVEYKLYLSWAKVRGTKNEAERDALIPTVRGLAAQALRRDPNFAFAHYILGHLALRDGDFVIAEGAFSKAHQLDPDSHETDELTKLDGSIPPLHASLRPSGRPTALPIVVPELTPLGLGVATPSLVPIAEAMKGGTLRPVASLVADLPLMPTPSPPESLRPTVDGLSEELVAAAAKERVSIEIVRTTVDGVELPSGSLAPPEDAEKKGGKAPISLPPVAKVPAIPSPQAKRKPVGVAKIAGMLAIAVAIPAAIVFYPSEESATSEGVTNGITIATTGNQAARAVPTTPAVPTLTTGSASALAASSAPGAASSLKPAPSAAPLVVPSASAVPSQATPAIDPTTTKAAATKVSEPPSGNSGEIKATGNTSLVRIQRGKGRRVFVDGKVVGEIPLELPLSCAKHTIQIGSKGEPKEYTLRCGETLEL